MRGETDDSLASVLAAINIISANRNSSSCHPILIFINLLQTPAISSPMIFLIKIESNKSYISRI